MILKSGDMWSAFGQYDLFLVTGNSYINRRGELVMGRGAALQAKNRFPELPKLAGKIISNTCGHLGFYGVIAVPELGNIGIFQTKFDFADSSRLSLIERSLGKLINMIEASGKTSVHLNFPGIGYGNLRRADVLRLLVKLLDIVTVWEYENETRR